MGAYIYTRKTLGMGFVRQTVTVVMKPMTECWGNNVAHAAAVTVLVAVIVRRNTSSVAKRRLLLLRAGRLAFPYVHYLFNPIPLPVRWRERAQVFSTPIQCSPVLQTQQLPLNIPARAKDYETVQFSVQMYACTCVYVCMRIVLVALKVAIGETLWRSYINWKLAGERLV